MPYSASTGKVGGEDPLASVSHGRNPPARATQSAPIEEDNSQVGALARYQVDTLDATADVFVAARLTFLVGRVGGWWPEISTYPGCSAD